MSRYYNNTTMLILCILSRKNRDWYCHVQGWLIRRVLDWMIGFIDTLYIHNSGLQALQSYRCSTHFAIHRYTRTKVLSLRQSYSGNGFITVALSLQITHEVFFAPPNSFLVIILQLPTQFNSKLLSQQAGVSQLHCILHCSSDLLCSFITPRDGHQGNHRFYC
jgi:hypothetical protein